MNGRGAVRARPGALTPAESLVVRPRVGSEGRVAHRPRALGGNVDRPAEGGEHDVGDPARGLGVARDDGAGGRALTSEPRGRARVTGSNAPPEAGISGSVRTRTTKKHAERVTASGQLRLPDAGARCPRSRSPPRRGRSYGGVDREIAVDRLDDVLRLVPAVRKRSERRPDAALGVGVELVRGRLDPLAAAPLDELPCPCLGEPVRRELRAQVAAPLVGVSRARRDPLDEVLVETRRRDHDSFLRELGARTRAGSRARSRRRPRGARG